MPFFKKKKSKVPETDASKRLPPDMVYSLTPRHGHAQDVFDENNIRQVAGCLPIDPIHKRFLLVSSSSNPGSWVIPKGGWEKDETQQQAAMRETWEEAGIKGVITRHIGVFAEKSKTGVKAHHWIYEMEIIEVTKKFPEMKKRERRWFTYDEAMLVVKASYITDALSMSSLSPLSRPDCDTLQPTEKKKEKKKKKQEEDDVIAAEEDLEEQKRKKEKKKEKKREKKERKLREAEEAVTSDEDEQGVPLTDEQKKQRRLTRLEAAATAASTDEEEENKETEKKKKKKKKDKKGEIVELAEDDMNPTFSSSSLNKTAEEKEKELEEKYKPIVQHLPVTQQLRQTHISPAPQPHQFPIPQPQFGSPPQQKQPVPSPQQPHQQNQQQQLRPLQALPQQRPSQYVIPQQRPAQQHIPQQRPAQQPMSHHPAPQQQPLMLQQGRPPPQQQQQQQQYASQQHQYQPQRPHEYAPNGQRAPGGNGFSQGPRIAQAYSPQQQRSPPQNFQGPYPGQQQQYIQRPSQYVHPQSRTGRHHKVEDTF